MFLRVEEKPSPAGALQRGGIVEGALKVGKGNIPAGGPLREACPQPSRLYHKVLLLLLFRGGGGLFPLGVILLIAVACSN